MPVSAGPSNRWETRGGRWPALTPASTEAPPSSATQTSERGLDARRLHERTPGGRSPLRPSDPPLEPEDEAVHLHRARWHLHHRPHPDAGAAGRGVQLREGDRRARWLDPLRRHQEAGAGLRPRRGVARRHAVRQQPLARRPAHELAHDLRPDPAPARAAQPQVGEHARPAAGEGAHPDGGRAREARVEPRRCGRHAPPARGRLHRRPPQGAARGARGAQARPAGDRARRHELRPGRGPVRDPGQRRRDSLVLRRGQGDRRRHRGGQEARDRERAEGAQREER